MKSKILIVEDEVIEAMNFQKSLESFGYDIVGIASTGEDALKMVADLSPDLILMDIILKGDMDGIEVAVRIKENYDIPVVYLTANPEDNAMKRAKLTTPYGILRKPVSHNDLRITLEFALHKHQMEDELKKSEKRYRHLYSSMSDGMGIHEVIYDKYNSPVDYKISDINQAYEEIVGVKKEEILNKKVTDAYGVGEPPHLDIFSEVANTGKPTQFETYFEPMDKFLKVSVFSPKKGFFVTVFENVTEQKKAEEERNKGELALKKSEEHFRAVTESAVDGVITINEDGSIIYCNDSLGTIFGYAKEEIIGRNLTILIPDKTKKAHTRGLETFKDSNDHLQVGKTIETIGVRKDRTEFPFEMSLAHWESEDQNFFTAIIRDLTKIKRIEKELIESEENLRIITDNMTDVIGQLDKEGNVTYISPSIKQLTGYESEELLDKITSDLIHPEDQEKFYNCIQDGIINKMPITIEYRTRKSDGEYLWLELNGNPVFGSDGEYRSAVFTLRDIDDRKKIEQKLLINNTLLEAQLNSTPAGIIVVNDESQLVLINQRFKDFFNIPQHILDSKDDKKIFQYSLNQFKDPENIMKQIEHLVERKNEKIHDHSETKDGRIFDKYSSPLIGENGHYYGRIYYLYDITQMKNAENEIKHTLKEKEVINQVIMQLVEVKDTSEIYAIIGKSIKKLLPNSYVLISTLDREMRNFTIAEALGLEDRINKLNNILGTDLYQIKFPMTNMTEETREKYQSSRLIIFEDGFYDLTLGKIPRTICKIIEKFLNIGNIYSIGFTREGIIYGSLNIILHKNQQLENQEVIETILNQGSIAIQHQKAEETIRRSLEEKEVLLREIHHRVKNNLQIISSLLDLQEGYISGDTAAVNVLKESQNRVVSMALIHEMIYQSEDLSLINFSDYIRNLTSSLFHSYGAKSNINSQINVEQIYLNIETAIPLGLLITELISNSLKYAFPNDEKGKIIINLKPSKENYQLIICDDGIGIPPNIDFNNQSTLGLRLVHSLVNQIDGTIQLDRTKGTKYTINFKELKYKKRF